jgi:hypothetical protein
MDASEWIEAGRLLCPCHVYPIKSSIGGSPSMSATTQESDMHRQPVNVRFVPAMNRHGPLFDHFVGAGEHTVGPIALRSGWERVGRRLSPFSFLVK